MALNLLSDTTESVPTRIHSQTRAKYTNNNMLTVPDTDMNKDNNNNKNNKNNNNNNNNYIYKAHWSHQK